MITVKEDAEASRGNGDYKSESGQSGGYVPLVGGTAPKQAGGAEAKVPQTGVVHAYVLGVRGSKGARNTTEDGNEESAPRGLCTHETMALISLDAKQT